MKMFVCVLATIVLCNIAAAQWIQTNGPSGGTVTRLVTNETNGYLFALASGDAYRSTDQGTTWTRSTASLQANLGATTITASGTSVYIGIGSGNTTYILSRSTDNGDTWTPATATGIPAFYIPSAMTVTGSRLLLYATYLLGGGKMFASTDGGENFTESGAGLPTNFAAGYFTQKGSTIFASNTNPGIYQSTDNGVNWTKSNSTIGGITGLTSNSSGVFVSTSTTGVYRSNGTDTVWTKINPDTPSNFTSSILATSTNLFIALGGAMMRADQNGGSWDSARVGLPPYNAGTAISAITKTGSSILCAYAKHGIYRTTDNGVNWFQSHEGVKSLKINGIHASNGYLFAAGDQYGNFRSADHGDTWTEINNGISVTAGWFCFARVGSDVLAGAGSSLLYRSSDNGNNWTLSNSGFALTNSFAFYVEGNTVYTTGAAGVSKSTDGGLTWNTLPAGYLFYEGGLDIWKDGSNILTGSNVASHRSTDDGASWTTTAGAIGAFTQMDSVLFNASLTLGVRKSTDHGASWTATGSFPFTVGPQCLTAKGQDLYAGTNDGVYRSTNYGTTWTAINDGFAPKTSIYKITFDDQYLYAGTVTRSVWRRPLSEITDVKEISQEIPSSYSLSQNYPNPFNPTTNFELRIANFGFVSVKIFDVLGNEITTLVNESLQPGTYNVSWNASNQPSGVYYYRLSSGSFSQTKKLLLMK